MSLRKFARNLRKPEGKVEESVERATVVEVWQNIPRYSMLGQSSMDPGKRDTSLVKQEANSTQSTMQYPHGKGEVPDQISH